MAVGPPDRRGHHPLRTIFQAVELYDLLDVTFGEGPAKVEIEGASLPADNTVSKTLRLSRELFQVGVSHVRLEKNIPSQAGLGGGSSDAAGVLRALCHVHPVSRPEMESVASAVGADVAFFLTGGRAKGEHYGERITPLQDSEEDWLVIAKPHVGCSTPEMFAKLDQKPREWAMFPDGDVLYNDFERVMPSVCQILIERLRLYGARDAGLSGSGSAVFGRFGEESGAEYAADKMRRHAKVDAWAVKTLTRAESLRIETL